MQELLNKTKQVIVKYWKTAAYVVVLGILLYYLILIITEKPQMPEDLKTKIDSLTSVNKNLEKQKDSINILLNNSKLKIDGLEFRLETQKDKIKIIKEYYAKPIDITIYTPTQIDSFFKQRYKY